MPILYGVRHLSPAGAWNLLRLLEEVQPDLVLVEGPSDLNHMMEPICQQETVPPIAVMAYSETVPIETILYPFAEYSPEYQAILWAGRNKKVCRFMDLPASVFLALQGLKKETLLQDEESKEQPINVYAKMAEAAEEENQETYWERRFEHTINGHAYWKAAKEYGKQLRDCTQDTREDFAENIIREAHMNRVIQAAIQEGFSADKIVVVCGSFHVKGLENGIPMTDQEEKSLPKVPCKSTLMPYSYYRLSSLSGYGAGNKAPAYYEMLWDGFQCDDPEKVCYQYLSKIADYQRRHGEITSSAEVIEAMRLTLALANMKNGFPTLQDLRDSAITCMGHGSFAEIAMAVADTEVGTKIGSLPVGVSQTSVQTDFHTRLKSLKLEKYKSVVAANLELDLRENTRVKSQKSAFLDLERSFFLHRVAILGIHFATKQSVSQDNATWKENWILQWTPEAEIEIVETALKGDTIELAVAYVLHEDLKNVQTITDTSLIIDKACLCGLPDTIRRATRTLQGLAVEAASVKELSETAYRLSSAIRYGSIRKIDAAPFLPILQQLFFRACLILPEGCVCNNNVVGEFTQAMGLLNEIAINHDFVDQEKWLSVLEEISNRDDLNTIASGYATAILLERGKIDNTLLAVEVERRLSKGIPADLGAGWFEGLSMKNKYALISRLSLWQNLSDYVDTLDEEEFKRALVFLRRAFTDFTPTERSEIAENLGEIWGIDPTQTSSVLMESAEEVEQEALDSLDDFDFGDL